MINSKLLDDFLILFLAHELKKIYQLTYEFWYSIIDILS